MWKTFILIAFLSGKGIANDCVPYRVDNKVIACICNATYCDGFSADEPEVPEEGSFYWYVTNKEGLRMKKSKLKFGSYETSVSNEKLTVDSSKKYQTIIGFGGGFTESVGINLEKLSPATRDQLIRAYYDPKTGSRYTLGRIPAAVTDFSTRYYTYDDVANDTSLKHFALTKEDYEYKIPYAKKALELNPETLFLSAAWTAPLWMKVSGNLNGLSFLKEEYYQTFANYLVKFLDEYKRNGLNMWAITTGNEPLSSLLLTAPYNTMAWTPQSVTDWVANYLGPALASSSHKETLVLALDDNRVLLPWFVEPTFNDENATKYVAGTAVHWYFDKYSPPNLLDRTHNKFPNKFLIMTESSVGPPIWDTPEVKSVSWQHGEKYVLGIIEHMNHWSTGWLDWNLALDKTGGPNWQHVYLDAAIIVNPETDEFYKLPTYYAIQHFSRFVDRGSVKISITDTDTIKTTAFLTPTKDVVVVLYNKDVSPKHVVLEDVQKGTTLSLELSPQSINTLKYKQ
ncbi:lysosomal acid glucosylceramidase-like [Xylocopa sonorina]|uniref:lysosomal acid glucosylceramidase-like n=1 Tax=Xylocopa sonorina TaxID=1818115 RepID=UPI00403A98BB